jgi:hypothetical protein
MLHSQQTLYQTLRRREINIPPTVPKNPVARKQPIRHTTVSGNMLSLSSHWLFPAHRVFRHTGRDFSPRYMMSSPTSRLALIVSPLRERCDNVVVMK